MRFRSPLIVRAYGGRSTNYNDLRAMAAGVQGVQRDGHGILIGLGGDIRMHADQRRKTGILRRRVPRGLAELERSHVQAVGETSA